MDQFKDQNLRSNFICLRFITLCSICTQHTILHTPLNMGCQTLSKEEGRCPHKGEMIYARFSSAKKCSKKLSSKPTRQITVPLAQHVKLPQQTKEEM